MKICVYVWIFNQMTFLWVFVCECEDFLNIKRCHILTIFLCLCNDDIFYVKCAVKWDINVSHINIRRKEINFTTVIDSNDLRLIDPIIASSKCLKFKGVHVLTHTEKSSVFIYFPIKVLTFPNSIKYSITIKSPCTLRQISFFF